MADYFSPLPTGNQDRSVSLISTNAGSLQLRECDPRAIRSNRVAERRGRLSGCAFRMAVLIARFGSGGFGLSAGHSSRSRNHILSVPKSEPHPSASETSWEGAHTHDSSSGSMTTTLQRSAQPFRVKRFWTRLCVSRRSALLPQPSRSNTTKAYRQELRKGRRSSTACTRHPESCPGCIRISCLTGRVPSRLGSFSSP